MKKKKMLTACVVVLTCLVMCVSGSKAQDDPNESLVLITANWFEQGVGVIPGSYQFRPYLMNLVEPYCYGEYKQTRATSVGIDAIHGRYVSVHTFFMEGDLNMLVITQNPQKENVVKYYFWPKEHLIWPKDFNGPKKITAIINQENEWEPAVYIPKNAGKTPSTGDYYISLLERNGKVKQLLLQPDNAHELRQMFAADFLAFPFSK